MSDRRAAVVHLGRAGGMGEIRRVESWRAIFEAAGIEVDVLPLRRDHPVSWRGLPGGVADAVMATAVPEVLSWSLPSVMAHLRASRPDVVVCVTARAYRPALVETGAPVVLDFVDRLGASYRSRAVLASDRARRSAFAALARAHERFEARALPAGVGVVAAGWTDAQALGGTWVPNVVSAAAADRTEDSVDHDLVFFGNLAYAPNVAAVEDLSAMWPAVAAARPGTTVLLAGANPVAPVRAAAGRHGWTLLAGFGRLEDVTRRARVAVAPLAHAAGIQNKVLEAAAHGLPQVISPESAAGLDPAFPARVAAGRDEFVAHVVELLDDADARSDLGHRARRHVATEYAAPAWVERVLALVEGRVAPPVPTHAERDAPG